jgi:hypothetical protein
MSFLTLLSPFLGIFGSILPSLVNIFARSMEMKYNVELVKLQLQISMQTAQIQMDIADAQADIADAQSVRSYDNNIDGGKFLNILKASIRPVITYTLFILFVAVKVAAATVMIKDGNSIPEMLANVWDQDTMALFGTIISFWFGARILEKMGYGGITPIGKINVLPTTKDMLKK